MRVPALLLLAGAWLGCASLDPSPPAWLGAWVPGSESPELKQSPASNLPAPKGLRAEGGGLRSIRLEWDPVLTGQVGGYAVERSLDAGESFEQVAVSRGRFATVFVDAGGELGDGVAADYRVRAFTPSGHLSATGSEPVRASTAPAPRPPDDLHAYSLQPRSVPLTWRAAADRGVVGYSVDRSPSSRGPFEEIARLEGRHSTVYVDEDLGPLRVFYYRVAATNAAGASGPASEPVRAVTKPEPLPPYQLTVASPGLGENRLRWQPNVETDLAGYRLLRRRQEGDAPEVVLSLAPDRTGATDRAVGADETVSYTVIALDADGLESVPADWVTTRSQGYDLVARVRPGSVELRWRARPEEGFVRARVRRSGRFATRDFAPVEGDLFVDSGVSPGARYDYAVTLERSDGSSAPPSRPVEVVIPGPEEQD